MCRLHSYKLKQEGGAGEVEKESSEMGKSCGRDVSRETSKEECMKLRWKVEEDGKKWNDSFTQ